MGNQNISPVEERLTAPSESRLIREYSVNSIVANQYRIDEKIGDGGMGTVYRCTDLVVRRTVAIKFLHPHLVSTSKWLLRFQQEATAIGRLHHPNVIQIHQFCAEADPPFIVMDFLEGQSLADLLASEGSITIKRCINMMRQVADALSHAHDMGVVHRDLKPSNVIILKNDVVQILDFGIAKLDDDETQSGIKLTQTGEVFGSPAYMSPEQCLGKRINAQSDQYSFGCMIYECLTGSPPFVGISPVEVMMKHVSDVPPSLKEASLGKEFPHELEVLVQKLLAKQPNERFDSMKDAMATLVEIGKSGHMFKKAIPAKKTTSKSPISLKHAGIALACLTGAGILVSLILSLSEVPEQKTVQKNQPSLGEKGRSQAEEISISANKSLIQEVKALDQGTLKFGPPKQTGISGEALEALPAYLPELRDLYLNRCEIADSGLESLVKLNNLRALFLDGTKITNVGLKTISQMRNLYLLHLADTNISDEGMKDIARLPNLRAVNLSYDQGITASGINTIAEPHRLIFLFLNGLDIHGACAELARNPLEQLNLDGCVFDDADLENISHNKTIKDLSLSETSIHSDSKWKSLMTMKSLKHLKIARCRHISIEMLDKLKKALPGCVVDSN